jgi:hypothetical protein
MLRLLPFLLISLVLAGCQGSSSDPAKVEPAAPAPAVFDADPKSVESTKVGLVRNDTTLHVGDDPDKAFEMFRGNKPGGFTSERLPPNFGGIYKARVWQGATEGIGVITYEGKVVAALQQEDGVTQERLNNEIVPAYMKLFDGVAPEIIRNEKSTSWFWTEELKTDAGTPAHQRTMIQALQMPNSLLYLTIAMGDEAVLDALDINPAKALTEQVEADKMFGNLETTKNPASEGERR